MKKHTAILLALVATVLMAAYQILWKIGANESFSITNIYLWLGFILFGAVALIILFALKGQEVSVIVPILGLNYFIVTLLANTILGEPLSSFKWFGMGLVFLGVTFVGISGGKE